MACEFGIKGGRRGVIPYKLPEITRQVSVPGNQAELDRRSVVGRKRPKEKKKNGNS